MITGHRPSPDSMTLFTSATCLLATASLAAASTAPEYSAIELEKLQNGEVLVECALDQNDGKLLKNISKTEVQATILIAAPVAEVWEVIDDKEAAPEYTESLLRAEIIEEGADHSLVEQELKVPRIPGTFTYTIRYVPDPPLRADFERYDGDLKEVQGSWQLIPHANGTETILIYELFLRPGMLVPQSIVNFSLRRSLPDVLIGVRKRVLEL